MATCAGAGSDNGEDWGARGARRYVIRAAEASLRQLDTDWIDLYQMHRPDSADADRGDPVGARRPGACREGPLPRVARTSAGWQIAEAEWQARSRHLDRFVSAQNEYNWLERDLEDDVVPALEHYGIGLLPYFPLASGLLTGKYRRGAGAPRPARGSPRGDSSRTSPTTAFDVVEALERFAADRGIGLLDVAIGGLAAQPAVASVIAGATSPDQIRANVAAGSWQPTLSELAELDGSPDGTDPPRSCR